MVINYILKYTDEKLEFDVIFINQNHKMKGIHIEINKEYVEGSDKYTIELL